MALPIRQRLSALTCLKAGPKAVLIEVCELAEHGSKAAVTASNAYLAQRLGSSERTVSRVLSDLERIGFIVVAERQGKARQMVPSPTVRAVYCEAQPSQIHLDNLAKMAKFGEVEPSQKWSQPSQNGSSNLAKNGDQPSQNGSRVYGDDQDDQLDDQEEQALRDELALAQKKIADLLAELADSENSLQLSRKTITDLRAELQASQTRARANGVATPNRQLPYSAEFAEKWESFRLTLGVASNGARERELLASLAKMASTEDEAVAIVAKALRKGWKDLYPLDAEQQPATGGHQPGSPQRNAITQRPSQVSQRQQVLAAARAKLHGTP